MSGVAINTWVIEEGGMAKFSTLLLNVCLTKMAYIVNNMKAFAIVKVKSVIRLILMSMMPVFVSQDMKSVTSQKNKPDQQQQQQGDNAISVLPANTHDPKSEQSPNA